MFYRSGGWYYCEACKPPDPNALVLTDLGVQPEPVWCAGCTRLLPARLPRTALNEDDFSPEQWSALVAMYRLQVAGADDASMHPGGRKFSSPFAGAGE